MQDFPANSQKAAKATEPPREPIKPVTSAKTGGRKKRALGRQFKETFFAGSGRGAVGHMVEDIVVPSIRDMFREALHGGIDQLFNGDRSSRPRTTSSSWMNNPAGQVNYRSISTPTRAAPPPRTLSRQSRARHEFSELIIPSRQEAEEVIDRLYDVLSQYGEVSVAHLYALVDVQTSHTDMKWGWTNLKGAKAVKLRTGGFLLDLPEPEPLG